MVTVPVADVDRAKAFFVEQLGCTVEQDIQVDPTHRFVELIPSGSACSIAQTTGYIDSQPGTLKGCSSTLTTSMAPTRSCLHAVSLFPMSRSRAIWS
jgi:catechol 2,3-dioxygenase-like lactoylglutathione lyase family enzyme